MNRTENEQIVAALSRDLIEPRITVVGCGGAGNNIVHSIYWSNKNVETIAVNTDEAKLEGVDAHKRILIGKDVTHGQGAGGFPEVGELCANMARGFIRDALKNSDIVFVVAGMGGGTGTGAAPVVAEIANELNAVTFAIAINPFSYEGSRQEVAKQGIDRLRQQVERTIVLENDYLLNLAGDSTVGESFAVIERSINKLIGSLNARISRELQEQIRIEVAEAFLDIDTVESAKPTRAPMAEILYAESTSDTIETPFPSKDIPEILSR